MPCVDSPLATQGGLQGSQEAGDPVADLHLFSHENACVSLSLQVGKILKNISDRNANRKLEPQTNSQNFHCYTKYKSHYFVDFGVLGKQRIIDFDLAPPMLTSFIENMDTLGHV